jgi:hypothetical protein
MKTYLNLRILQNSQTLDKAQKYEEGSRSVKKSSTTFFIGQG